MRIILTHKLLADLDFKSYEAQVLEVIKIESDKMFERGCISDHINKDFRFKLGYIQALKELLKLNEDMRNEDGT